MKRIFLGITYILLLVMMFVYLLIPCWNGITDAANGTKGTFNVLVRTSNTGLPVIGMVFIFPAFIFSIIALCNDKPMTNFLRDVFGLFAGVFCLVSAIVFVVKEPSNEIFALFVPIILMVCAALSTVLGSIGVVTGIRNDDIKRTANNNTKEDAE